MLEQADRARKMAEQELSDTNETLADLTVQNQSLSSSKRKLEQDLADLRHEADEALNEARQMVSTTLDKCTYMFTLIFPSNCFHGKEIIFYRRKRLGR